MSELLIGALAVVGLACFGCLAHCVYKLFKAPGWLYERFINQISYRNAHYAYLGACVAGLYLMVFGGTRSLLFTIHVCLGAADEFDELYPLIEVIAALAAFCSISVINVIHRYLLLDNESRTKHEGAITNRSI